MAAYLPQDWPDGVRPPGSEEFEELAIQAVRTSVSVKAGQPQTLVKRVQSPAADHLKPSPLSHVLMAQRWVTSGGSVGATWGSGAPDSIRRLITESGARVKPVTSMKRCRSDAPEFASFRRLSDRFGSETNGPTQFASGSPVDGIDPALGSNGRSGIT
jgi:hypothetical protein